MKIGKTKIEYGDYAWNPVVGCLRECPYCWARRFARRFWVKIFNKECLFIKEKLSFADYLAQGSFVKSKLESFNPIFLEYAFAKTFSKEPSIILVGFMSDIAYWKSEWMQRVLDKIAKYPQHKFIFLTKEPNIYYGCDYPNNCILGFTVTNNNELCTFQDTAVGIKINNGNKNKLLLNIEPILENLEEKYFDINVFDWIIVGGLTPKPIHKTEWIDEIIKQTKKHKIPLFLKDNLKYNKIIREIPIWQEII